MTGAKEVPKGLVIAAAVLAIAFVIGLAWMFLGSTPGTTPPAPPGTKLKSPPPPPPPMAR